MRLPLGDHEYEYHYRTAGFGKGCQGKEWNNNNKVQCS